MSICKNGSIINLAKRISFLLSRTNKCGNNIQSRRILGTNSYILSATKEVKAPSYEQDIDATFFQHVDIKEYDNEITELLTESCTANELNIENEFELSNESTVKQITMPQKKNESDLTFINLIEACLMSNNLPGALNLLRQLITHRERNKSYTIIYSPKIYEIVLKKLSIIQDIWIKSEMTRDDSYAKPIEIMQQLFKYMDRLKVTPSPLCYSFALLLLTSDQNVYLEMVFLLKQINEEGYTIADIILSLEHDKKLQRLLFNQLKRRIKNSGDNKTLLNKLEEINLDHEAPENSLTEQFHNRSLKTGSFHIPDLKYKDYIENFKKQISVERKGFLTVPSIMAENHNKKVAKAQFDDFLERVHKELTQEFFTVKKIEKSRLKFYSSLRYVSKSKYIYPFLTLLPTREYVDIMVNMIKTFPLNGETTASIAFKLGEQVYKRSGVHNSLNELSSFEAVYRDYLKLYTDPKYSGKLPSKLWKELETKHNHIIKDEILQPWTSYWTISVGLRLLEIMLNIVKLNIGNGPACVPALYNTYSIRGNKMVGMTVPHPFLSKALLKMENHLIFETEQAPMVSPPLPWLSEKQGGYLITPTDLTRRVNSGYEYDAYLDRITQDGDPNQISYVCDAINTISSVAWKVNKPILNLQTHFFRNKIGKELEIPLPPSEGPQVPDMSNMRALSREERNKLREETNRALKEQAEMYSLWMDGLYKLSFVNKYQDRMVWLPHNMDFRGRCYPIAPYFNYMGSDMYRSLFLFAQGRPLGKSGLDWLKIHCVNLTGFKKKEPNSERLEYANSIIDDILQSAYNPTDKAAWWRFAEEPWQTLSVCFEIAAAMRMENPEEYVSHLPVHQDGSCNGLQHYAAMGRDILGAHQVNVSPSDSPQDVYMGVAKKAEELRARGADNGHEIAQVLDGFITRKVVKQTVMTTVYGVTRYGGKLQIQRKLEDMENFPIGESDRSSSYLVVLVFECIKQMFESARNIQDWLTEIAQILSHLNHPTEWITPLGMRVVQPYYRLKRSQVSSTFQLVNVMRDTRLINSLKQKNGVAPNFVHSLDSTHMMLTALSCVHEGMVFSAVHDCYWTHACDIANMNKFCRVQFVELHSQPILQNFADHLKKLLPPSDSNKWRKEHSHLERLLNNIPEPGDFDLESVKKSTYFFN